MTPAPSTRSYSTSAGGWRTSKSHPSVVSRIATLSKPDVALVIEANGNLNMPAESGFRPATLAAVDTAGRSN